MCHISKWDNASLCSIQSEEALRELNIHIIADKATPIKCMLYNGKAKNGYFAYFQGQNRNGVTNNYPCYCVIPDQLGVNNLGDRDAGINPNCSKPEEFMEPS